ncbi:MAG: HAMP domain-containing protein [Propionibacteriaceae bacterium]|jgi:signal transduction histidine kinase|nr:HAMP domain-containing protein [Propionibacteriaceae bacterium]
MSPTVAPAAVPDNRSVPWLTRFSLTKAVAVICTAIIAAGLISAFVTAYLMGPSVFQRRMLEAGFDPAMVDQNGWRTFTMSWLSVLFVSSAVATVCAILVGVFFARRLVRAFSGLHDAAVRIAQGDLTARITRVPFGSEFEAFRGAFNSMAQQLSQIEEVRTRVLGDLAHEMRTPLSTLDAYLEAIADGVEPADTSNVALLRQQTARLTRLASDISLVTITAEGGLSLYCEPQSVGELLETAVQSAQVRYAGRQVELVLALGPGLEQALVQADFDRMGQVLTNLLDNSLRHTSAGGRVVVAARPLGGRFGPSGSAAGSERVSITVTDNGDGVAPEHLPHLFDRFYRVDSSRQRLPDRGGSGIGLSLVKALVQAQHGSIAVDSPGLGQGTTVTVTLPLLGL